MANIAIKSEKLTPFGGIFPIMEQFDSMLSVIDSTLGQRCSTNIGYKYSEITRSLMCAYFCGDSCSREIVSEIEYTYRCIPTNDYKSTTREILVCCSP